jgi:hypothetical protein
MLHSSTIKQLCSLRECSGSCLMQPLRTLLNDLRSVSRERKHVRTSQCLDQCQNVTMPTVQPESCPASLSLCPEIPGTCPVARQLHRVTPRQILPRCSAAWSRQLDLQRNRLDGIDATNSRIVMDAMRGLRLELRSAEPTMDRTKIS